MVLSRKIAEIDLTTGRVADTRVPPDLRKKYLGGRGVNMALLSRVYSPS